MILLAEEDTASPKNQSKVQILIAFIFSLKLANMLKGFKEVGFFINKP